ncbi:neuromedin-U receptor 2-like [Lingula anatina]|uniref:Neuromedin-U receptor 2-like n=1 Tax=Lingula anatina TaxID=7574 RepID=A0A1S3I7Z2_LINAN|nr:neuromedin-U receptor 2-like [Lingula anatina]XP_023931660.1 neuromedin-U receptor 2-like [Lingula anatina]XP_023931661.1 neuromedin-U receptor 2-like [Lingula anatina]XP_023931662.1 neuromedin-U receptor 2-like [Lingula anatina]XP_023931663.1 neuromedin-U receptor 2-like [Lingula anatina]XP_023931664.1 neuromedin-U receptor 2-like [Lingula anatina]XP_023931665.1 neuromedin-U receptor 2-like [Lingula anatina]|eukprot:XP_013393494.2 neuromedin-U receptor 2-like [Lingula anatina]
MEEANVTNASWPYIHQFQTAVTAGNHYVFPGTEDVLVAVGMLLTNTSTETLKPFDLCNMHGKHMDLDVNLTRSPIYEATLSAHRAYTLSHQLYIWLLPVVILFGTVGNVLSFLVVRRHKKMQNFPIRIYISVLSVADTLVLYLSGFRYWVGKVTGADIKMLNDLFCAVFGGFLYHFVRHLAVWTVVVVTCERFLLLTFPTQTFTVLRRPMVIMAVLSAVIAVIDSSTLFTFRITDDCVFNDGSTTMTIQHRCVANMTVARSIWPWIDFSMYCFIPVTILCFMNIAIMFGLFRADTKRDMCKYNAIVAHSRYHSHRKFARTSSTASCESTASKLSYGKPANKKGYFTVMPLVVSTTLILLTTPITVLEIIYSDIKTADPHVVSVIRLIRTITFLLMYVNHSINLLLYVITGRTFRKELCNMFPCTTSCREQQRSNSSRDLATFNVSKNRKTKINV